MPIELCFVKLPKPAKAIAGSPSKNAKRAASSRLRPSARAAVNVEPERDIPGISAPTCAMPTIIASARDTLSMVRLWRAQTSLIASRMAITMLAHPITLSGVAAPETDGWTTNRRDTARDRHLPPLLVCRRAPGDGGNDWSRPTARAGLRRWGAASNA
jgi:hypothetical protein